VLWGTDSIWYGSPQDQIQAFRAFQIADALVQQHGYPALTPAVKAKVLGLNGAKLYGVDPVAVMRHGANDPVGRRKVAEDSRPSFATYGPKTAVEYDAFLAERGPSPV
jgi:hypothetical protein